MKPTQEQIAKLPKWAQAHIADLERGQDDAIDRLERFQDTDTPTHISYTEFVARGTDRKKYVQADRLDIDFLGVHLAINLVDDVGRGLEMAWRPSGWGHPMANLCFIPTGYQQARITNIAYDPREFSRLVDLKEREESDDRT